MTIAASFGKCCKAIVYILGTMALIFVGLAIYANHYLNEEPPSSLTAADVVNARRFDVFSIISDGTVEYMGNTAAGQTTKTPTTKVVGKKMKRLDNVISEVVEARSPIVLASSRVADWGLMHLDLWNMATGSWPVLGDVLSMSSHIRLASASADSKTFVVQDHFSEPGGRISTGTSRHQPVKVNKELYLANFLLNVKNTSQCSFYSTNYRVMESLTKMNDKSSWTDFRIIERIAADNNISATQVAPLFSMLSPNCALQARYSESHTFKVQLQGSGRYLISPPSDLKSLYMYPSIHVSAMQSQVAFGDAQEQQNIFPRFKNVTFTEVLLNSGDVLYVPPYHVVRSEARTLSVTLDILSPSEEQIRLTEAYLTPLPFDSKLFRGSSSASTTSTAHGVSSSKSGTSAGPGAGDSDTSIADHKTVSAQVFLVHFLSRVQGMSSIKRYSKNLLKSRFYPVVSPPNGLAAETNRFSCYSSTPEELKLHKSIVNK